MDSLKICVYAIAKNEEKFIERFCESAKEADLIVILDTGSSDNTVKIAKKRGATVYENPIHPWRFDTARNAALQFIPVSFDVCFCADVDEILQPGWRQEIERLWIKNKTNKMYYLFESQPGHVWYNCKIHSRQGYVWKHICHEMLFADPRMKINSVTTDKLLLIHKPDNSKSRASYLGLLEADMLDNQNNGRSLFYYGRELYYYKKYTEAIEQFNHYLKIDESFSLERNFILRTKAESLMKLKQMEEALKICRLACQEYPSIREPWVLLGDICYSLEKWRECFFAATSALDINIRNHHYTSSPAAWGWKPYDLAALSSYHLKIKVLAIEYGLKALELNPEDKRLKDNLKYYQEMP